MPGQQRRDVYIGQVIAVMEGSIDNPHEKYNVIVGISDDGADVASVWINSKKYNATPNLSALQYELDPASNTFISHISYADCSKIWTNPKSHFTDALRTDSANRGQVNRNDIKAIIDILLEAETTKEHIINRYCITKIG